MWLVVVPTEEVPPLPVVARMFHPRRLLPSKLPFLMGDAAAATVGQAEAEAEAVEVTVVVKEEIWIEVSSWIWV